MIDLDDLGGDSNPRSPAGDIGSLSPPHSSSARSRQSAWDLHRFNVSTFGLSTTKRRPAISVVTHGEVRVLASRNGWGEAKLNALEVALDALVTVDVNVAEVIDAYVKIEHHANQKTKETKASITRRPSMPFFKFSKSGKAPGTFPRKRP